MSAHVGLRALLLSIHLSLPTTFERIPRYQHCDGIGAFFCVDFLLNSEPEPIPDTVQCVERDVVQLSSCLCIFRLGNHIAILLAIQDNQVAAPEEIKQLQKGGINVWWLK